MVESVNASCIEQTVENRGHSAASEHHKNNNKQKRQRCRLMRPHPNRSSPFRGKQPASKQRRILHKYLHECLPCFRFLKARVECRKDIGSTCSSLIDGLANLMSFSSWHTATAFVLWKSWHTSTLISASGPALRSQLICSSWCHLRAVPAGSSGLEKTSPSVCWVPAKKQGAAAMKMDYPAADTASVSARATLEC